MKIEIDTMHNIEVLEEGGKELCDEYQRLQWRLNVGLTTD